MKEWINNRIDNWAKKRVTRMLLRRKYGTNWHKFLVLLNDFDMDGVLIIEDSFKIECSELELIKIPSQKVTMEFECTNRKLLSEFSMMKKNGVLDEYSLRWAKFELSKYIFEAQMNNKTIK